MPWMRSPDAAAHFKIAERTLRERAQNDPDRWRRDGAGRYWVPDAPEGVTDKPRPAPVPLDALPPAQPRAAPPRRPVEPVSGQVQKWIAIPDVHVPYHDPHVLGLIVRAGEAIGATRCVQLGDLTDCYSVSRFPKDRNRRLDIAWELDSTCEVVSVLDRAFPDERVITLGNHDVRMERYISEKAPEIAALFPTYVDRIGFKERGWRVTSYMDGTKIGDLHCTHEVGYSGQNAAHQTLGVYQSNVIFGHTHRIGFAVAGDLDGKKRVGAMLGWVGDTSKIDYHHRARVARESAHGFGIIYVEPDGRSTVVPVVVSEGRCVVEGKVIR